jgi:hypothetical protein
MNGSECAIVSDQLGSSCPEVVTIVTQGVGKVAIWIEHSWLRLVASSLPSHRFIIDICDSANGTTLPHDCGFSILPVRASQPIYKEVAISIPLVFSAGRLGDEATAFRWARVCTSPLRIAGVD